MSFIQHLWAKERSSNRSSFINSFIIVSPAAYQISFLFFLLWVDHWWSLECVRRFSCVSIEIGRVKFLPCPCDTRPLPVVQRHPTVGAHNFPLHPITSPGSQTERILSRSGNGISTGCKENFRFLSSLRSPEATFQAAGIVVTAGAGWQQPSHWPMTSKTHQKLSARSRR